jgi:uncharacterized protein
MSRSPAAQFRVEIAALRRHPGERREFHLSGQLDELFVTAARVPEGSPITIDGVLESVSGGILVTATVRAPYEGECRRCLDTFGSTLSAEVVELVTDEPDPDTGYAITGDTLDVRGMVHDACILELPPAPLCKEGCLGLCPACGVNRNLEQCSCELPPDARWAALAGLAGAELTERADLPRGRDGDRGGQATQ